MTQRAVDVLKQVDCIAAEDTRHSARLMQHYHIATPLIAYHDHSDATQVARIVEKLRAGQSVALISDAGTPLISDPGYRLVTKVRSEGMTVVPIPGPCAVIAALSASGLPCDRFSFEGFPPAKQKARQSQFEALLKDTRTLIFYESPHRITASLADMRDIFGGDRQIVFARELTKTFETFLSGTLDEICVKVAEDDNQRRGEIVVMVRGAQEEEKREALDEATEKTMRILMQELSVKQAAALASKLTGEKKNRLYQWALEQQGK